jgi:hypothetical protein
MADLLSQYSVIGYASGHATSARNMHIQSASLEVYVAAMYSASVVDRVTMGCFLELQETAPLWIVNTDPEIEWRCF